MGHNSLQVTRIFKK